MEFERRTFTAELRAEPEGRKLTGYAAVFDSMSRDLGGFRETIRAGAFAKTLEADVRALWNHDPNYPLARTKSGTLALREDSTGLRIEADLPNTTYANDLLESIRRGDVDQMSFAFRTIEDTWEKRDGENVRELIEVELFDVSPVTFPAYEETSVSARALAMCDQLNQEQDTTDETGAGDAVDTMDGERKPEARREYCRHRFDLLRHSITGDTDDE